MLIAGISITLQSGGRRPPSGRAMTATRTALALRGLMIIAIGLLLGPTETSVEIILAYYGILFLLAIPLLGLGRRTLLALAAVFAVLGPVAMQLVRAWWPDMPRLDAEYTFALAGANPGTFLTDMLFTGNYPALPWLAYICVGLAVGRLDLTCRKVGAVHLAAGTSLAASMWVLSALLLGPGGGYERLVAATPLLDRAQINQFMSLGEAEAADALPATTGWWLAILAPHTSTPVTILSTLGTSLAVLGVILLLVPHLGRITSPFGGGGFHDSDPLLRSRDYPCQRRSRPGTSGHCYHHPMHPLPPRRRPLAQRRRQGSPGSSRRRGHRLAPHSGPHRPPPRRPAQTGPQRGRAERNLRRRGAWNSLINFC
ncbi:heparan-alpha-glucosaminide N-acetyltransferase domain-containing protein [Arthrobacter crystallopoietes]|uniref:heparan-alpha-glucosaminide N-acetyltransferase domain-containing protein n=1 Tax=Crystallibacter crystallopoietes TaxID=37928 RepID=UPI0009423554|nr:hypothetical protein AC20117_15725 [Arthrobacter crystallopoietes]